MKYYGLSFGLVGNKTYYLESGEEPNRSTTEGFKSAADLFDEITRQYPGEPYFALGIMLGLKNQASFIKNIEFTLPEIKTLAGKFQTDAEVIDAKLRQDPFVLWPEIPKYFFTDATFSDYDVPQALIMLLNRLVYIFKDPADYNDMIFQLFENEHNLGQAQDEYSLFIREQMDSNQEAAEYWSEYLV